MGHKPANGPDAAPSHNPCVGQSSNPDKLDATAGSRRLALFWPRWRQLKLRPHWHHRLLWPVLRMADPWEPGCHRSRLVPAAMTVLRMHGAWPAWWPAKYSAYRFLRLWRWQCTRPARTLVQPRPGLHALRGLAFWSHQGL